MRGSGPVAPNVPMTHHDPPRRPHGGRGNALAWILTAVGVVFGIAFAVAGVSLLGVAVFAVAGANSIGSNK